MTENEENLNLMKPDLQLKIGNVVYLASDLEYKTPMTIEASFPFSEDSDHRVVWLNSNNQIERLCVPESVLMTKKQPEDESL